ncbi:sigma-70 family RNA polymerase sigma factor [Halobacillus locisalis]|uniref:Sigma-70 family RNA polymerase sigma factor n=1 Tax=Halobacillus locisalis TaxID=220753 RepID=A0A838CTY0_9BACI|nr:sigma-70 family RNA polymerase sigma factor [Halobacillus locisalis]MBA2175527.1 sigma-70 family RNA polymerase sigma factor [Halobacillus locisalis]
MNTITFKSLEKLIYYTLRNLHIPPPFDDHFQESYVIFKKCLGQYDGTRAEFSTYFTSQLQYHLRSFLRNEHRHQQVIQQLSQQPQPPNGEMLDDRLLLTDILHFHQLTSLEQQVVELSYAGYSVKHIAHTTEVSVSTILRTRKRIKQKLSENAVYLS